MNSHDRALTNRQRDVLAALRAHLEANREALAHHDLPPRLLFHTLDGRERVVLFPTMDTDPDSINNLHRAVVVLASAIDELGSITLAADTYTSTSPTKSDGSPWGRGEMEAVFLRGEEDAQLVKEAFTYQVVHADGSLLGCTVPYTRHTDSHQLHYDWDRVLWDQRSEGPSNEPEGMLTRMLREAIAAPKLFDQIVQHQDGIPAQFHLSEDQARMHTLAATIKLVLTSMDLSVLLHCRSSEEADLMRTSLDNDPATSGLRTVDAKDIAEIAELNAMWNAE